MQNAVCKIQQKYNAESMQNCIKGENQKIQKCKKTKCNKIETETRKIELETRKIECKMQKPKTQNSFPPHWKCTLFPL